MNFRLQNNMVTECISYLRRACSEEGKCCGVRVSYLVDGCHLVHRAHHEGGARVGDGLAAALTHALCAWNGQGVHSKLPVALLCDRSPAHAARSAKRTAGLARDAQASP